MQLNYYLRAPLVHKIPQYMALSAANKEIVDKAIKAIHERVFYAQYPEHPKAYGEDAPKLGLTAFNKQLGKAV